MNIEGTKKGEITRNHIRVQDNNAVKKANLQSHTTHKTHRSDDNPHNPYIPNTSPASSYLSSDYRSIAAAV